MYRSCNVSFIFSNKCRNASRYLPYCTFKTISLCSHRLFLEFFTRSVFLLTDTFLHLRCLSQKSKVNTVRWTLGTFHLALVTLVNIICPLTFVKQQGWIDSKNSKWNVIHSRQSENRLATTADQRDNSQNIAARPFDCQLFTYTCYRELGNSGIFSNMDIKSRIFAPPMPFDRAFSVAIQSS